MSDHPVEHEAWPRFVKFANEDGIPLDYEEDWQPWWTCFLRGWHGHEGANKS